MDLRWEAYNLGRFRHNFRGDAGVSFPSVCEGLLAPGLLVETWVHGPPPAPWHPPGAERPPPAPPFPRPLA